MLERAFCMRTVMHNLCERACDVLRKSWNPSENERQPALTSHAFHSWHISWSWWDDKTQKNKNRRDGFSNENDKAFVFVCVHEKWDDEVAVCSGRLQTEGGIKYRNGILGNMNVNRERRKCYFICLLLWKPSNQEWQARRKFLSLLIFLLVLVFPGKTVCTQRTHLLSLYSWHTKKQNKKHRNSALHPIEYWIKTTEHECTTLAEMRNRCRIGYFEKGFKERDWQQACDQKHSLTNITLYLILFWLPTIFQKEPNARKDVRFTCFIPMWQNIYFHTYFKYIKTYILIIFKVYLYIYYILVYILVTHIHCSNV